MSAFNVITFVVLNALDNGGSSVHIYIHLCFCVSIVVLPVMRFCSLFDMNALVYSPSSNFVELHCRFD